MHGLTTFPFGHKNNIAYARRDILWKEKIEHGYSCQEYVATHNLQENKYRRNLVPYIANVDYLITNTAEHLYFFWKVF